MMPLAPPADVSRKISTDHANAQPWFVAMIDMQNTVFFGELVFEVLLGALGYGIGGFYNDIWKAFDLFVCMGTAIGYVSGSARMGQFAKTFRILRVIRLMKMIKPIRVIMETLLICVPQLLNIILLLFLVYSMFAVVGMENFGVTKYGWRLGPTANYYSYSSSMFTIFQIITGDDWHEMQGDLQVIAPACTQQFNADYVYGWHDSAGWDKYRAEGYSFGDCGSEYAPLFCIPMIIVCSQVMLNLFIGIILDKPLLHLKTAYTLDCAFMYVCIHLARPRRLLGCSTGMILDNFSFITEDVAQQEDVNWDTGSSSEQIQELCAVFMKHDCGTGFVSLNALHTILVELPQPLGFKDVKGQVVFGGRERAAELLICAEINVYVRAARQFKEDHNTTKVVLHFLITRLKLEHRLGFMLDMHIKKPDRFSCQICFTDLMTIILSWRKPDMVCNYPPPPSNMHSCTHHTRGTCFAPMPYSAFPRALHTAPVALSFCREPGAHARA